MLVFCKSPSIQYEASTDALFRRVMLGSLGMERSGKFFVVVVVHAYDHGPRLEWMRMEQNGIESIRLLFTILGD
jgi:hypothetical protein